MVPKHEAAVGSEDSLMDLVGVGQHQKALQTRSQPELAVKADKAGSGWKATTPEEGGRELERIGRSERMLR